MNIHLIQIPLASFPVIWIILAVISIVIGISLAISGYKRYRGEKILYPPENLVVWLVSIFKGKEEGKKVKKRIEMDQRRHKLFGISAIIGAMWCFLLAILFIVAAVIMPGLLG